VIAAVRRAKAQVLNTAWADTNPQPDQLVADRLTDRLAEAGGPAGVTDPVGWLLRRGLPRRAAGCPEQRCDDGTLMDTRAPCGACKSRIGDRAALRASFATEVAETMYQANAAERRAAVERRMRELTNDQAQSAVRSAEQRVRQRAAVAEQQQADAIRVREQVQAAESERQARPCSGCGTPRSAGLCAACSEGRRTEQLVADAVAVAVAAWADLDDAADQTAIAAHIDREIRTRIEQAVDTARRNGALPELLLVSARWEAAAVAEEYRRSALAHLARGHAATTEARLAADVCLHGRHPSLAAAQAAADQAGAEARDRAAAALLQDRLTRLRALQAGGGAARQVAEADMCADGCGRIALRASPRCRRCHTDAVLAADRAAGRGRRTVPVMSTERQPGAATAASTGWDEHSRE
jgi:hypothetical protein